jgi:hypothetical protein
VKVHLTRVSGNTKTGPIPVTTSSRETCPPTCKLKAAGCYASGGPIKLHWDRVTSGDRGAPWPDFVDEISRLPKGQIWRHNQAGDLQGKDGVINAVALRQLVKANKGRRGFTYTHYEATPANVKAVLHANANGFVVNMSADSLEKADALKALGVPVVAIVEPGWSEGLSPGGNRVTVCPAQRMEDMNCARCQLCQRSDRHAIVAFEAHGFQKNSVIKIMREAG